MPSAPSAAPTTVARSSRSDPIGTGLTRSDGPPAGPGTVRIAVALLGGDNAPAVVVDGALQACGADPELSLLLVGPRSVADEVISASSTGGVGAGPGHGVLVAERRVDM